ncbi:1961_t:CDS:2 [Diversispora eburnea]|uniref:1961_t:CDS:1 n=1 Tax=Diversispora eburnea TaxID=1213867 RepID=A0A9N8WFK6_9GLOM|nr:1961_t:CDS:2 [Diversispora eburnea]
MSKKNRFFGNYIAISSDCQQIVTFNPVTHEFKLYDIDNLSSSKRTFTLKCGVNGKHLCWSIAISNCIDSSVNERFIALSCFEASEFGHYEIYDEDENDLDKSQYDIESSDKVKRNQYDLEFDDKVNYQYDDDDIDLESGDKYLRPPQTWVISTADGSEIYTSLEYGVIRFLESIVIVNVWRIFKEIIKNKKKTKAKKFKFSQQVSFRLLRNHWQNSLELLRTSIIKNHFMIHSFKDRQQFIEMYSLITGNLEMLFKRHESLEAPDIIHGSPIFSISQNEKILAFCRGTASITLYFMENGLEIVTKQLESQRGIYKIVAINFIDDDSKLLIVLEEKEDRSRKISKNQIFVIWDLFTTFKNSIRQIDYSENNKPLKMDVTHRLMNTHGNMFAVRDNGEIFSVLNHPDVALIRNPSVKAMTKINIITKDHIYHAIYNIDGERFDASKLEKHQIIIKNVEPWHPGKNYSRISVYLDSTESTQLIISSNTIQVWKYRNNNTIEKRDKRRDRVLEYIWAQNKAMHVQELRIGKREFMLKILVPSTKRLTPETMTIHWPNNVNVLEGACRALYLLGEKKHIVAGYENVNKIKYLVECTQRLVRKYITKYGIFRLTSIRYPIMECLIKSFQESLIRHILFKKINKKNSNIYIPRLYKWPDEDNTRSTNEISKSDLHHAILCTLRRENSPVILKYLIDYYANNAKEYNNYGEFVQYLFKKPCFGITEAYTPPLHINPYDQKKGNNTTVIHSLVTRPRLASKFHKTLWFFLENLFKRFQTSRRDRKVYIVPLRDFTLYPVYPKYFKNHSQKFSKYFRLLLTLCRISLWPRRKVINNTKEMSPFLRVIHEENEKGHEIYQTPTIMAVLDFKWPAARQYFIRHIILYLLYVISFVITLGSYSSKITYLFKMESDIILKISLFVYFYTGWYLIVTEIVQLKREGLSRYVNIYNMFDLGSLLLPLANIASILYDYHVSILQNSVYNFVLAFTALVMWLQLVGRFIHIIQTILNIIWPILAVMFIVVVAFGHAMFILLNYADDFQIPTYKIKDASNSDLYSNITIYQNINKFSRLDNYYSHFVSSVEAVFFWTNGRWDQLDQWNSYAVDVMSVLGSIILVDAFEQANKNSRTAVYRYRIELIAEYEALEKPFGCERGNPRDIYYIPNPDMIDTWITKTKKDDEKQRRLMSPSSTMDSIKPSTIKYTGTINKISFIDEEIFSLNKKSQRNSKSNNKLLKNVSNEPSDPTNVDDQLSMQERFNNLESEVKTRFNNLENEFKTRFDELEQNLKIILQTLNNSK